MESKELLEIAENKLLKVTNRPDIIMCEGKGMYLFDVNGTEYLDFIGGWAVNCIGHSPEVISNVLSKQSRILVNASPSFYNLPMLEYANLLTNNCCFERVFFTSTGAEANEGAIKLARKFGAICKNGASDIITTQLGFHGRTLTTMSATGKPQWETLFEPKTKGFHKATFNDFDSIKKLVTEKTCAIMFEPIQGEGGVNVASNDFVTKVREFCDENNILLIFDEIQTGMGRTGKMFCYEHYSIEPDIMTLGKGIGGGFPLSAVLAKEELNIFEPGEQGGTYTGQPLSMSVGLAVLHEILDKNLVEHCREMGEFIKNQLFEMSQQYEITNIRGKGLLLAFDLLHSTGVDVANQCLQKGLIVNSLKDKSIRLIPPLIVTQQETEKMLSIIKKCLKKAIA